jgi:hypothetical protein
VAFWAGAPGYPEAAPAGPGSPPVPAGGAVSRTRGNTPMYIGIGTIVVIVIIVLIILLIRRGI